jgi:hypothetical protein
MNIENNEIKLTALQRAKKKYYEKIKNVYTCQRRNKLYDKPLPIFI